ncbi:hypothetical protein [Zavarzinella formosa]|uniref:hypothetical protein n=1 Tax=Zavarzinella formosa TaxID=360055 RepID=UPI0002F84482|nr:hypothetical protein [Zavarzinella formosa]
MTDRNERTPEESLARAVIALRDLSIPDGPPAQLTASTVEALQSAMTRPGIHRPTERKQKMFRLFRYSGTAAAVVLIATLAGWLFVTDHSTAFAFGDVVENVKKAETVTFVIKSTPKVRFPKVMRQKIYIQGDSYRQEIPSGQEGDETPAGTPPLLMTVVSDVKKKEALIIDYTAKTAAKYDGDEEEWKRMSETMTDPVKQLRELKDQDAERLGEEKLDGRKTVVYRLKNADFFANWIDLKYETAKLWVDSKTALPVRFAVGDPANKDKPFIVFEQFSWNEALPPTLFRLEVPKGFTLKNE